MSDRSHALRQEEILKEFPDVTEGEKQAARTEFIWFLDHQLISEAYNEELFTVLFARYSRSWVENRNGLIFIRCLAVGIALFGCYLSAGWYYDWFIGSDLLGFTDWDFGGYAMYIEFLLPLALGIIVLIFGLYLYLESYQDRTEDHLKYEYRTQIERYNPRHGGDGFNIEEEEEFYLTPQDT